MDLELDDNASVFRLVIQAVLVMSQLLFRSIYRAVVVFLKMENRSVHSKSIESNPSKIPNDGERVVLLSLVSRVVKNDVVKNNSDLIDIQREDQQIVKNKVVMHKILQIVLLIFLQLEYEWILKKYQVDNNDDLEWSMKRYTVNNNDKATYSDPSTSSGYSDNNYEDRYVVITSATKVECLEWYMQKYRVNNDANLDCILKWYQVDNVYESKYSKYKHNDCQLLLF